MEKDGGWGENAHYLAVVQLLGNNICSDFVPLDYVASVLGVAAHCTATGTFVEAITDLLSCKW